MIDIARSLTVVVDGRPPSMNSRRHFRTVARDNANWKEVAKGAAAIARGDWTHRHSLVWRSFARCTLSITFVVPQKRARDWDNVVSTMKPLLDGIVQAGIIDDDSDAVIEWIGLSIRYEKGRAATLFEFVELVE